MAIFAHNDVKLPRKLLTLIAMISEAGNIDFYFDVKMKVSIVDMPLFKRDANRTSLGI